MAAAAPEINSALSKFIEFIYGYDIVGHNVAFDMKFLDKYLARIDKSIYNGRMYNNSNELCNYLKHKICLQSIVRHIFIRKALYGL